MHAWKITYPDEDQLGITGASIGVARVVVHGTAISALVRVNAQGWKYAIPDGPQDETRHHSANTRQEEWATAKLVNSEGGADGDDQVEGSLADREAQLLVLVRNTSTGVNGVDVVGEECVTRVL